MRWLSTFAAALFAATAHGQVHLGEEAKVGDLARVEVSLTLQGVMKVERDGKPEALPMGATATHAFAERVEAADARGATVRVRHYEAAKSAGESAGERTTRELGADRRLVVAQRTDAGTLHFSPDGPLSREELELVGEHFDPATLQGLLPNKPVQANDVWAIAPDAVQRVCLLEGLVKADFSGKVTAVTPTAVTFTVGGTAEGIDNGAAVKLTVSATGTFDVAAKRVTNLKWEQADSRGQGAASPASEVKATITLTRQPLAEEPKALDIAARAKVPADGKSTALMTMLRYTDAAGRFQFVYPREWHVVGRTKDHLVLRLLDGGEFTAQATLTVLKKLDAGAQMPVDDFKKLVMAVPGWLPETVSEDGVVPTEAGSRLYRLTAQGKQDGVPVQQTFYHLAGSQGEQVAVTVLARADKVVKVGTRDLSLVNAVEFPKPAAPVKP